MRVGVHPRIDGEGTRKAVNNERDADGPDRRPSGLPTKLPGQSRLVTLNDASIHVAFSFSFCGSPLFHIPIYFFKQLFFNLLCRT